MNPLVRDGLLMNENTVDLHCSGEVQLELTSRSYDLEVNAHIAFNFSFLRINAKIQGIVMHVKTGSVRI